MFSERIVAKLKQSFNKNKELIITVFILLIASLLSFGNFSSTIISSDDWSLIVEKYAFSDLRPYYLDDRRPLALIMYFALSSLWGLQMEYYYMVNFFIHLFSSILVFLILKQVLTENSWLATLIAAVYLIYPVDHSRTWLIMIHIRLWWLISLGSIWLMIKYVQSGNFWTYFFAMFGILIPLGSYEGQIGIVIASVGLISFLNRGSNLFRRLILLCSIGFIYVSFYIWRFYMQSILFGVSDAYVGNFQLSISVILNRLIIGLDVFLKGWINLAQGKFGLSTPQILIGLIVYSIIVYLISNIWKPHSLQASAKVNSEDKKYQTNSLLKLLLMGSFLWAAGYFPIIGLYPPSLQGYASRVNLFAIAGGSIAFVSLIAIIVTLISRSPDQKRMLTTLSVVPFFMIGIFTQQQINQEREIAWESQKKIWSGIIKTIPNLANEKEIVIVIPGYTQLRSYQSYPFLSSWEINAGVKVLYNNPEVGGKYYYQDIQNSSQHFTESGFRTITTDKIIPYKRLIFVHVSENLESAYIIEDLAQELSLPLEIYNYTPYENIILPTLSTEKFRWLLR